MWENPELEDLANEQPLMGAVLTCSIDGHGLDQAHVFNPIHSSLSAVTAPFFCGRLVLQKLPDLRDFTIENVLGECDRSKSNRNLKSA